jgi:hypothetical protein
MKETRQSGNIQAATEIPFIIIFRIRGNRRELFSSLAASIEDLVFGHAVLEFPTVGNDLG